MVVLSVQTREALCHSRHLVGSSSLLCHPRCEEWLNCAAPKVVLSYRSFRNPDGSLELYAVLVYERAATLQNLQLQGIVFAVVGRSVSIVVYFLGHICCVRSATTLWNFDAVLGKARASLSFKFGLCQNGGESNRTDFCVDIRVTANPGTGG